MSLRKCPLENKIEKAFTEKWEGKRVRNKKTRKKGYVKRAGICDPWPVEYMWVQWDGTEHEVLCCGRTIEDMEEL